MTVSINVVTEFPMKDNTIIRNIKVRTVGELLEALNPFSDRPGLVVLSNDEGEEVMSLYDNEQNTLFKLKETTDNRLKELGLIG